MLTVDQVKESEAEIKDPIIDVPLKRNRRYLSSFLLRKKEHVSVKLAMAQLGGTAIRFTDGCC